VRVGYFADGVWSHRALEKLLQNDDIEIAFIVPRYDVQDPVLKDWARKISVDYIPIPNVNSDEALARLETYNADLMVSMSFNQILKKDIIQLAPKGFINCHTGNLPFYRGRNILNWALINDAKEFGVTVHFVDEGIDTGDIVLQDVALISDYDDYSTLLDRAIELCAEVLFQAVVIIANGEEKKIQQDIIHPVGFYCGRRREGDEWIDWSWDSRRVFNFVRSITKPGPCARTLVNGKLVTVQKVSMIEGAPKYIGTPGEIVGKNGQYLIVKTGDSTIRLEEYELSAEITSLSIGHRLGIDIAGNLISLMARVSELESQINTLIYSESGMIE